MTQHDAQSVQKRRQVEHGAVERVGSQSCRSRARRIQSKAEREERSCKDKFTVLGLGEHCWVGRHLLAAESDEFTDQVDEAV